MKRYFRLVQVLYWLVAFFVRGWCISFTTPCPTKRRQKLARNTSFIARMLLKPFGLHVRVTNPEKLPMLRTENHLIVANHVSYTDILVLASLHPFVFITSEEMGSNPVLGDITRLGGSLFTNRQKFSSLPQEIARFSEALSQGFDVVLFPEGTSTNGETIKDFRKSLFQTSLLAHKPLLPICIRYRKLDGKPIDITNRDTVCWYGDMTFVPHFMQIIRHHIDVEVTLLDAIPYSSELNRQDLSDRVRSQLLNVFHTV